MMVRFVRLVLALVLAGASMTSSRIALAQAPRPHSDSAMRGKVRDSTTARHAMQHTMPGTSGTKDRAMPMSMGTAPLGLPMERMGSGTSWLPDATPMHATHSALGGWDIMLHGVAFLQYDDQGSKRGDEQLGSVNWGMVMAGRDFVGGRLDLRGMLSAEPFTIGSRGYPLLLQSGEEYHGMPLHDRQHPHDLLMEIAALYDHAIARDVAVSLYVAPVGEPVIGPVAFPHRPSAQNDPLAPLGHHWQDATHIAFGVITAGVYTRTMKLEASLFNGREPDEVRTNFDYSGRSLDSYAGRLTVNPTARWSVSGSYAYLESPERLHPDESLRRVSASVLYARPFNMSGDWASSLIYGANKHSDETQLSSSLLAETNLAIDSRNTVFGRLEWVEKSDADLAVAQPASPLPLAASAPMTFDVGELTVGYVRELANISGGSLGLGAAATLNVIPSTLQPTYGTRTPVGATIFLRLRPGRMHIGMKQHAPGKMQGMKMRSTNLEL